MRFESTIMVLPRLGRRFSQVPGRTAAVAAILLLPLVAGCTAARKSAPPPSAEVIVPTERTPAPIVEATEWPYAETPPVPEGYRVHRRIQDLTFPAGSASLTAEGRGALTETIRVLAENPAWQVLSVGFTDGKGEPGALAKSRAETVSKLLKSGGVDAARLSTLGLGSEYARASEYEPGQQARDRRVEIWAFSR